MDRKSKEKITLGLGVVLLATSALGVLFLVVGFPLGVPRGKVELVMAVLLVVLSGCAGIVVVLGIKKGWPLGDWLYGFCLVFLAVVYGWEVFRSPTPWLPALCAVVASGYLCGATVLLATAWRATRQGDAAHESSSVPWYRLAGVVVICATALAVGTRYWQVQTLSGIIEEFPLYVVAVMGAGRCFSLDGRVPPRQPDLRPPVRRGHGGLSPWPKGGNES